MFKLVSDIHLELGGVHALHRHPCTTLLTSHGATTLILAGDCGKPVTPVFTSFLTRASAAFQQILIVPGNHEYYNGTKEDVDTAMETWIDELNTQVGHNKVILLNHNTTVYIPDKNIRILGCTLWSHIPDEALRDVQHGLNDFRMIGTCNQTSKTPRRITTSDYNAWHQTDLAWLKREIKSATERNERIIVVTHHPPTFEQTSAEEFRNSDNLMRFAFASDLEDFLGGNVVCWCYGHTHFSNDMVFRGTRVVSNQAGYLAERGGNKNWNPRKVIVIEGLPLKLDTCDSLD